MKKCTEYRKHGGWQTEQINYLQCNDEADQIIMFKPERRFFVWSASKVK